MTSAALSRRQFLRGDFSSRSAVVRPPWSVGDAAFVNRCSRCDECIKACPEKILIQDRQGFPQVDFLLGECSFCGDCAKVCREGAFLPVTQTPWNWVASIHQSCVAFKQVECRICAEQCEAEAISFRPTAGQIARPALDPSLCSGCGACVALCPTRAIHMARATAQPTHQVRRGQMG